MIEVHFIKKFSIYIVQQFNVSIMIEPLGTPVLGTDNTFEYLAGTDLNLTCLVTPTPPAGSEFNWTCSTGCFADMEMEQNISAMDLDTADSGVINCHLNADGIEFSSGSIVLIVLMMGKKHTVNVIKFNTV